MVGAGGGRSRGRKDQGEEGWEKEGAGKGTIWGRKEQAGEEEGLEDGIRIGRRPVEVGDNSWHREQGGREARLVGIIRIVCLFLYWEYC